MSEISWKSVSSMILEHVDILCIAESKLDLSFPIGQFCITGFKQPARLDISDRSGGLLLYARDGLPVRYLSCPIMNDDIQCIPIELNLRKQKWLILSIYRNPRQNLKYFLDKITKFLIIIPLIMKIILLWVILMRWLHKVKSLVL